MGPRETIGQQELLISMGPCGAIDSNSCILVVDKKSVAWHRRFGRERSTSSFMSWRTISRGDEIPDVFGDSSNALMIKWIGGWSGSKTSFSDILPNCPPRVWQWAHTKPSATAAAYFDGPMRNHRQQQLHMPMGPCDTIGSSSCICRWAHAKPSATTVAYSNGPKRSYRQHLLGN